MSAPAWIMDAIYASKLGCVPNPPNRKNHNWELTEIHEPLINKRFTSNVPIVPPLPREMQSSWKTLEVVDMQRERRRAKVLLMMEGMRFAILVEDGSSDPVIATIGIQNIATFEMAIPLHSYDGILLLELIEKHYGENYANI